MSKYNITKVIHRSMACVGGFLGGYMILTRFDTFGNAQTVNLISLVLALVGADFIQVIQRIGVVVCYVLGAVIYVLVTDSKRYNGKMLAIVFDLLAFLLIGFITQETNVIYVLYPCAFSMSYQWCAFPGYGDYVSSTIFSTNNTKQSSLAMTKYLLHHKKEDLERGLFFMGTLLFFHIGVVFSFLAVKAWNIKSAWAGILLLLFPAIFIAKENKK